MDRAHEPDTRGARFSVKFTPEGGCIEISAWRDAESVCFRVSDTGAGIAPDFLPHLFERFRQADGTTTRRHGGLGLGLAIVRNLAELHGGSVHAQSDGENTGTTLVVMLPAATSAQPCADTAQSPVSTEAAELARQSCLQGMRVLVVDDSNDSLQMMTTLLESLGAEVRGAESADEGLVQLIGWRPDALVSDIAMPGRDGFWLIEQVRSLAPAEGGMTPAVALTALADREDAARILRAGFHRHLPKPVSPEELGTVMLALTGKG